MALPCGAGNADAVAVVDGLHSALITIMRDAKALGFEGRRERIAPVVERSFDLPFIAQFTLGRHWSELNPGQQKLMVDVFSRLTIANYAARFNDFSGEQFQTLASDPARKGRELVRTVLKVDNDSANDVTLDYLLHETGQGWRIINVIANGVSDLSLKRADYGAVMKSGGFDSLIAKLSDQIKDLESKR
jgi:phospholipid transport system substrate-binding protein